MCRNRIAGKQQRPNAISPRPTHTQAWQSLLLVAAVFALVPAVFALVSAACELPPAACELATPAGA